MISEPSDPLDMARGLLAQAAVWLFEKAHETGSYDSNECTELREWFAMRVAEYKAALDADLAAVAGHLGVEPPKA